RPGRRGPPPPGGLAARPPALPPGDQRPRRVRRGRRPRRVDEAGRLGGRRRRDGRRPRPPLFGAGMTTASPEELRGLFLFEDLDEEKLAWLSQYGTVEEYPADGVICAQGDAAEFLYVLLDGEMVMTQNVR